MKTLKKTIALLLVADLLVTGIVAQAHAGMIDFATVIANEEQRSSGGDIDRASLETFLIQKLTYLGVEPDRAMQRVRALTDEEFKILANRFDNLPSAAGALEVIGITFLILLILELVGVIDIFKRV